MTKDQLLHKAKMEVGTKENPPNSNTVKYNDWFYGKPVSGASFPWCCAFVAWLFKEDQKLCKKTASCLDLMEWFEAHNQIVKTPMAGDIVFFKFSTNNRRTNHVGIVYEVNGNTITTIEGNTSQTSNDNGGSVMMRKRKANIVGYARPAYNNEYFPQVLGHSSIVEALESIGVDSSKEYRKRIWKANFNGTYLFTADQNKKMLNHLASGNLIKPI